MTDLRPPPFLTMADESAKTSALIGYALMLLGSVTGLCWLIGFFWAVFKKEEARGTLFEDHFQNIIHTFWWSLAWSAVGFILVFVLVGYFVLFAVWVWSTYRFVKGLARLSSNKPYQGTV